MPQQHPLCVADCCEEWDGWVIHGLMLEQHISKRQLATKVLTSETRSQCPCGRCPLHAFPKASNEVEPAQILLPIGKQDCCMQWGLALDVACTQTCSTQVLLKPGAAA